MDSFRLTDQPNVRRAFYFGLVTGLPLLRTADSFSCGASSPAGGCVSGWSWRFGRAVHGGCLRLHPALGQGQNRVADPNYLDGRGIFSQRTLHLKFSWLNIDMFSKTFRLYQFSFMECLARAFDCFNCGHHLLHWPNSTIFY